MLREGGLEAEGRFEGAGVLVRGEPGSLRPNREASPKPGALATLGRPPSHWDRRSSLQNLVLSWPGELTAEGLPEARLREESGREGGWRSEGLGFRLPEACRVSPPRQWDLGLSTPGEARSNPSGKKGCYSFHRQKETEDTGPQVRG